MTNKWLIVILVFTFQTGFSQEKQGLTDDLLGVFLEVGDWIQKLESKVNVVVDKEKKEKVKRSLNYLIQDFQDFRTKSSTLVNQIQLAIHKNDANNLEITDEQLKKLEKNLNNIGKRLTHLSTQLLGNEIDESIIHFIESLNKNKLNRSNLIYTIKDYLQINSAETDLEGMLCIAEQLHFSVEQSLNVCYQLLRSIN